MTAPVLPHYEPRMTSSKVEFWSPHGVTWEGRTYYLSGHGISELAAFSRPLSEAEGNALPAAIHEGFHAFWRRLRAAPRTVLKEDQWFGSYRTDLDGWRYTWWEDRHDPAEGLEAERIDPLVEMLNAGPRTVRFSVGTQTPGAQAITTLHPRAGGRFDVRSTWFLPDGSERLDCESWSAPQVAAAFRAAHPPEEVPTELTPPVSLSPAQSARLPGPGVYLLGPGNHVIEGEGPLLLRALPGARLRRLVARGDVELDELPVYVTAGEAVRVEQGSLDVVGGNWQIDPEARAVVWQDGTCRFSGVIFQGTGTHVEIRGGTAVFEGCSLSRGGMVVGGADGREARLQVKKGEIRVTTEALRVESGGRLEVEDTTLMRPSYRGVVVLNGGAARLRQVQVVRAGESGVVVFPEGRLEMEGGSVQHCGDRGILLAGPSQIQGTRVQGCKVGIASYATSLRLTRVEVTDSKEGGIFVYYPQARAHLEGCIVRGSGDANLEVSQQAQVLSIDGIFEGGRAAGVSAREGAQVELRGGRLVGNAGPSAEGLDEAQVLLSGVTVDRGGFGRVSGS